MAYPDQAHFSTQNRVEVKGRKTEEDGKNVAVNSVVQHIGCSARPSKIGEQAEIGYKKEAAEEYPAVRGPEVISHASGYEGEESLCV
jgi:hypothetical protein